METIKGKDFLQAVITMREFQKLRAKGQCTQELCSRNEAKVDSMIKQLTEHKENKTRSLF